jgi:hypothetical protein
MRQFRTADNSLNLQLLDNVLQYKGEVILGIYNHPCRPLPIFSALARNAPYNSKGSSTSAALNGSSTML